MSKIDNKLVPLAVTVRLADVLPNPWNPNKHRPRVFEALKESIRDHGDIDPMLLRGHPDLPGKYQVIDGEHRLDAYRELGFTEVTAQVVAASEEQAKKLTIILNETRGEADRVELATLLADLQTSYGDDLRSGLPYSDEELDARLALADVDWGAFAADADADDPAEAEGGTPSAEGALTFAVTDAEAAAIKSAVADAREDDPDLRTDGAALALICRRLPPTFVVARDGGEAVS